MKLLPLLTSLLLTLWSCCAFAQEYSYTHYDISDGLAGSDVYCITQDKDGFIWTGTETGVSRFDGTHFHNYTTIDGLPDVEILEMFGDSRGRVWMAPFRKSICYYYKGRIYNQDNDSILHTIQLRDNVNRFAEDDAGNILVQERTALHLVGPDGSVREYDSIGGLPIRNCGAISRSNDGHFIVQMDGEVYTFSGKGFEPLFPIMIQSAWPAFIFINPSGMIWRVDDDHSAIRSFATGKMIFLPFSRIYYKHISYTCAGDSLYYFNEYSGATEYNIHTGRTRRFLPGKQVSRTYRDATGNTWFTTLGQGLYRLNSDEFRTIRLNAPGMETSSIFAINRIKDRLLVGDDHNYIYDFSLPDMTLRKAVTITGVSKNRILYCGMMPGGNYFVASDVSIVHCNPALQKLGFVSLSIKSVFPRSPDQLLVCGHWGAGLFDLTNFRLTETLWHDRATTLYYRKDTIFIGTLDGLYARTSNKTLVFLGKGIPFLKKRISAIAESPDGTLWIASYDSGLIGYRDGRVIATLTQQQGLTSNICRTLLVHENDLWIGTDKGLNRVRLDQAGYPVTRYTSKDGLGSDIINSIFADSSFIYVGTPAGMSFFDQNKVNLSEGCPLYLLSLINSGRERIGDTAHLVLPYTDKHLRVEFAGISYRSVGGITYRYRLNGLDSTWRTTQETFLEYLTLPSGNYTLELQAINKFGTRSALLQLPFRVITPFWESAWFYVLIVLAFLSLTWAIISLRIRQIRNRQKQKELLNQRMIELENTALQAQMNPHFIFNCLNSIQQYIFNQDILEANKYIAGFSRLIRATLQSSSKAFIPLPDEIGYLSGYLALEKLRFKEKMDYVIEVDPALDAEACILPPMLIQPYVENSMRHGLRHKTGGSGCIRVRFEKVADRLVVTIEDNGIGRMKAAVFKTREHIEYQSQGMTLTADRIRMINKKYGNSIHTEVIDLVDEAGQPAGTRVVMEFPLFHILLDNQAI